MAIDAGGWGINRVNVGGNSFSDPFTEQIENMPPAPTPSAGPSVRLKIDETHDGAECDCISEEIELLVGDTVSLLHTCRDGRKDEVRATVLEVKSDPGIEHGTIRVTQDPKNHQRRWRKS